MDKKTSGAQWLSFRQAILAHTLILIHIHIQHLLTN